MSRFLDLDAVVVPDIDVGLGGEKYVVPGSPDVPRMLLWMQFNSRLEKADGDESIALLGEMYADLLALFQIHQPELEKLPIHQEQIATLFEALFGQYAEDDAPDPTPAKAPRRKNSRRSA